MKLFDEVWKFLKKDTWPSFFVTLLLAFVFIKFVFFPGMAFLTGSSLPLVIVESCSMHHHEYGFERIIESSVYQDNDIFLSNTTGWDFQNGFTKGDVIFVVGADEPEVGDVIIFDAGATHPLIHRVVRAEATYGTKGDNYKTNFNQLASEKFIDEDQIIGKALFRVPFIGWAKLLFFEGARPPGDRGFCE